MIISTLVCTLKHYKPSNNFLTAPCRFQEDLMLPVKRNCTLHKFKMPTPRVIQELSSYFWYPGTGHWIGMADPGLCSSDKLCCWVEQAAQFFTVLPPGPGQVWSLSSLEDGERRQQGPERWRFFNHCSHFTTPDLRSPASSLWLLPSSLQVGAFFLGQKSDSPSLRPVPSLPFWVVYFFSGAESLA